MKASKKHKPFSVELYDRNHRLMASYLPEEVPLCRKMVLQKCMEFFHDPNPCFIHQGAAKLRMLHELEAALNTSEQPVAVTDLPEEMQQYVSVETPFHFIRCYYGKSD